MPGMKTRTLGPFHVREIGFGCMNISHAYGEPLPAAEGARLLNAALDAGHTLMDTATLYGFGANETLVGQALKSRRQEFVLASKCGLGGVTGADGKVTRTIDGRPEALRRHCEDSLRRLQTDVIDLYYLHRWDKRVPIEESVGELSRLVEAGKVRTLGLSEVGAAALRRAHAVHPITALQNEYSLWSREPEIAVLQACRELGVTFVAFSPLGRGFLGDRLQEVDSLPAADFRRNLPRYQPPQFTRNAALLPTLRALAREAGCTPAQLALAWLLQRGPAIIPIPGTRSLAHLQENVGAADVHLSPAVIAQAEALFARDRVAGERYPAQTQAEVDTETF